MVGRKGRSKGCLSCRQRHIKCDETRPTCRRCEQSGYLCTGYPSIQFYAYEAGTKVVRQAPLPNTSPRWQDLSPLSDVTYATYLKHNLFPDILPSRWPGLTAINTPGNLSYHCLQALAQTWYGRVHAANEITNNGSRLYLKSLEQVRTQLNLHVRVWSADLILSATILVTYEMLVLSSSRGWVDHALGLGVMIEMLGPEAFVDESSLLLFESNRFIIILASLALCRKTFLSRAEWKATPWSINPLSKSSMQYLLDIMADLTELRELGSSRTSNPGLQIASLEFVQNLLIWRKAWDASQESETSSRPDQTDFPPDSRLKFHLHYKSLQSANCVCLYNAAMILACEIGMDALKESTQILYDVLNTHNLGDLSFQAALEICQSVQYQLTELQSGMLGQLFVLYPLRMAWKSFNGTSAPEMEWVARTIWQISNGEQKWDVSKQTITYRAVA